jgi:hypothetical protein
MSDIKIIEITGDFEVVNNDLVLISRADEVKQRLTQRLRTFLEEWFLDTTIGIPFHQQIFIKGISPNRIGTFFKNEILGTPGVLGLLEYKQDFSSQTRQFSVSFKVLASDNEILQINEVVG